MSLTCAPPEWMITTMAPERSRPPRKVDEFSWPPRPDLVDEMLPPGTPTKGDAAAAQPPHAAQPTSIWFEPVDVATSESSLTPTDAAPSPDDSPRTEPQAGIATAEYEPEPSIATTPSNVTRPWRGRAVLITTASLLAIVIAWPLILGRQSPAGVDVPPPASSPVAASRVTPKAPQPSPISESTHAAPAASAETAAAQPTVDTDTPIEPRPPLLTAKTARTIVPRAVATADAQRSVERPAAASVTRPLPWAPHFLRSGAKNDSAAKPPAVVLTPDPVVPAIATPDSPPPVTPAASPPVAVPSEPSAAPIATMTTSSPPPRTISNASEEQLIASTLQRYASAYEQLDVDLAQAVWPTVDRDALARAFKTLEYQQFNFDECRVRVGGQTASADCDGWVTFVPKVGSKDARTVARRWDFELSKGTESWRITQARMR